MKVVLSVRVKNREVYQSQPKKISVLTDVMSVVLKELDKSPPDTIDWTDMSIRVYRE
jgi:hypothetical protein